MIVWKKSKRYKRLFNECALSKDIRLNYTKQELFEMIMVFEEMYRK